MTDKEKWDEIEERLYTVGSAIAHRSYVPGSRGEVRHLLLLVRNQLVKIEELLLEEETQAAANSAHDGVLQSLNRLMFGDDSEAGN